MTARAPERLRTLLCTESRLSAYPACRRALDVYEPCCVPNPACLPTLTVAEPWTVCEPAAVPRNPTLAHQCRDPSLIQPRGIPGKKCGCIIFSAEELSNCRDIATMQLCANKLDKKDFFGKSDPFLVFYRSNEDGTFTICHKTEVIKNNLNPVWQPFTIPVRALCNGDYDRTVKVDVFDWDRDGSHDFIGEFTTSYRELSRGQSQFNVYEVLNPKKKGKKKKYVNSGTVTLLSFKVESEYTFVDFIRGGRRMVVQNLFEAVRKSFSMASPNSSHVRVFASVTATSALRLACRYLPAASGVPQAKKFDGIPHRRCPPAGSGIAATAGTDHLAATALVGRLNNGGTEHGPLGLNVPRLPRYMVKALPEVGVEALSDRRLCQTFPADPHDTFGSARSDRHSPPPSQPTHHQFLFFTRTQLNFTVAIDFTASNGNPSQPTSLHYMSPYQMNAYAMALKAVGEIIQDYDSDKLFPAYGFGAKLPPDSKISHAFPLTMCDLKTAHAPWLHPTQNSNTEDPNCIAIKGVLEAYFQSLRTVQLYGPTNFAPVINQVARCAADMTDGSQYFVLLMITDGVISDMAQTKEAVVNAAGLPMSIIIVGVGPAEFDAMEELDGDEVRVSSRGRFAERDIVQTRSTDRSEKSLLCKLALLFPSRLKFVPFRDYIARSGNQVLSMARLAKDVLAEIPDQLLSFMKSRGIEPRPAVPATTSQSPSIATTTNTSSIAK
ncbi:Copine-9 [Merluccius polli]|uniref:Copine-9 n=1 Tax=Merluccius polli TaxID=89951 RepID=A0AA47P072_MERPO|nr:Copine-9 [Merluccius polli]